MLKLKEIGSKQKYGHVFILTTEEVDNYIRNGKNSRIVRYCNVGFHHP